MPPSTSELWNAALTRIRSRITEQQFETWFRNLSCDEGSGREEIVLRAPNRFSSSWLTNNYSRMIEECLRDAAGKPVSVAITEKGESVSGPVAARIREPVPQAPRHGQPAIPLNRFCVFETFVTGPCNALARAAAAAVSESPGEAYNPLFIHSSVGMGKTHLLQACCHEILARHPGVNILYLSCENFVNKFINAVERGELETFRYNYRHVDVLVIDDIHFLANKVRTQEEFFHTFNTLYHSQKQIILSSDSPPKEIPSLKDRLVTRFKQGLVVKLEAPELETRIAIVRMKAKLLDRQIPGEVVEYIASRVATNIRELEGAVVRVLGVATLTEKKLSPELAREALNDVNFPSPRISISEIQAVVADKFNIKVTDLLGKRRLKSIAFPRQICMYLAKSLTTLSLVEIGGHFGGRDHTTVMYGVDKISKMTKNDPALAEQINRLRDSLLSR